MRPGRRRRPRCRTSPVPLPVRPGAALSPRRLRSAWQLRGYHGRSPFGTVDVEGSVDGGSALGEATQAAAEGGVGPAAAVVLDSYGQHLLALRDEHAGLGGLSVLRG